MEILWRSERILILFCPATWNFLNYNLHLAAGFAGWTLSFDVFYTFLTVTSRSENN